LPEVIRQAAASEFDPDTRILEMLGARGSHMAAESDDRSTTTRPQLAQASRMARSAASATVARRLAPTCADSTNQTSSWALHE